MENMVPSAEREGGWVGELIRLGSATLVAAIILMAYHYFVMERSKPRFAVVDINSILRLKEMQVTLMLGKAEEMDHAGKDAFDEISRFSTSVEAAVIALKKECRCMLLTKTAVISTDGADDLTPLLKQRLELANLDEVSMMREFRAMGRNGMNSALPPSASPKTEMFGDAP